MDKRMFERYEQEPSLAPLLREHVVREAETEDPLKYGRIRFTSKGTCPFLDNDGLCGIQKRHGEDYLGRVCAQYPRAYNDFAGRKQGALYLSCPEAARVVLFDPDLLPARSMPEGAFSPNNSATAISKSVAKHVREFTLFVLYCDGYPLWQRLMLVGLFCRRAQELLLHAANAAEFAALLEEHLRLILDGSLKPQLDTLPKRSALHLETVLQLIQARYAFGQPSDAFAGCVADLLVAIRHTPGAPLVESAALYEGAASAYESGFEQQFPHLLRNYVVNYVFRTRFPFSDTVDMFERQPEPLCSYLLMLYHYVFLRSLLIGAGVQRPLQEADVVRVTTAFCKDVEHHPSYLEELKAAIRTRGRADVDTLAVLLRN